MPDSLQEVKGESHPIITGLGLHHRDQHLLDYWIGNLAKKRKSDEVHQPGSLAAGLNYFPNADFRNIQELAQWHLPILVVARLGMELCQDELFSFLLDLGLASLWLLPDYEKPIIFPSILSIQRQQRVFLIEQSQSCRNLLRQIFYFAGYHVQTDFRTSHDVVALIENGAIPDLLFWNLDHSDIHHTELIHFLEKFLANHLHVKNQLRILLTKDLSVPGFSLNSLGSFSHAHVQRIFSPQEAIFALIDAFFCQTEKENEEFYSFRQNTMMQNDLGDAALTQKLLRRNALDSILYGNRNDFTQMNLLKLTHPGLVPFLWLYNTIGKNMKSGIILGRSN